MVEFVLGLLAIGVAAAIAGGLTVGLVSVPLGSGTLVFLILLGSSLILRGLYRHQLSRTTGALHDIRTRGLMLVTCGVTLIAALTLPALSESMNLISVAGFPLGLYAMGQGVLLLFVVLLFIHAVRQNRIDAGSDAP